MELTTEYLIIIEKRTSEALFRLCDSVEAFNKFLETEPVIKVNEGQLKYQDQATFAYEVKTGEVEGKEQRFFHVRLTYSGEEQHLAKFTGLNRVIRGLVHSAEGQPETLWNDISLFYSQKAYPYIHRIENLMRKLITYFMLTNVGKEWVAEASPATVKEAIDHSKRSQYIDVLHQIDFKHLGDFLFKAYQTRDINELYDMLDDLQEKDELILDELASFRARSNWDRYFSEIVDCEGDYLDKRWDQLYDLRCMVAHNALIGRDEYDRIVRLVNDVGGYLQKAIDNLDKIYVPDEDREQVAENVASRLSASYGDFIELWKKLESALEKLGTDLDLGVEADRTSLQYTLEAVRDNGLIDETQFAEGMELIRFRNLIVHGTSVPLTEQEVGRYISRLESLVGTLKSMLKPASFRKECIARLERHLKRPLVGHLRTTYSSEDGELALTCAISKTHDKRGDTPYYWFSFHRYQKEFLEQAKESYVAFGCGSEDTIVLMPHEGFSRFLNYMGVTDSNNRYYWHVHILRNDGELYLQRSGATDVDITEYVLSDEASS